MSILSLTAPIQGRSAASLQRRFVARAAVAGSVAIAAFGLAAHFTLGRSDAVRQAINVSIVALVLLLTGLLIAVWYFVATSVSRPSSELAQAAEAVANGDFSVQPQHTSADDEMGRLSRALVAMVMELRRLASAITGSAGETRAMSAEITAGSEQMAATAGEIASTASDLSAQATTMAESISTLAGAAGSLREVAAALDDGAHEGVVRNAALRTMSLENRAGLDESSQSLETLAAEVHDSASAVEELGRASEEIRSFVTLVRKLARQSKLLALNAAMEAARAGEHGEGFAVVAAEVRRLAAMSNDAAERTEEIVTGVLQGIARSRESAERAVATAQTVRESTVRASRSFSEIERAVADADVWTASIEQTSATTSNLVEVMTERLQELAGGTESFAAAMEQVAASSEEQSASTQEIAGAAATLAAAAERLTKLVGGMRVA